MRDKKMEQSIRGVALILLLSYFLISAPSSTKNTEEKVEAVPNNIENVLQQDEDLSNTKELEENVQ